MDWLFSKGFCSRVQEEVRAHLLLHFSAMLPCFITYFGENPEFRR